MEATEVGAGDEREPVLGDGLEAEQRKSWKPHKNLIEEFFDVGHGFCRHFELPKSQLPTQKGLFRVSASVPHYIKTAQSTGPSEQAPVQIQVRVGNSCMYDRVPKSQPLKIVRVGKNRSKR